MQYYELYQSLNFGYIKTKTELKIYLRVGINVYLPKGVSLMSAISGRGPDWTIDYYLTVDNSSLADYLFQTTDLIFLKSTLLPAKTDPSSLTSAVRKELTGSLLPAGTKYAATSNLYNEKKELVGQVTNTIANDGEIVIV